MTSKIEYLTNTWNFMGGCSPISEGCANCWACRQAAGRLKNHPLYKGLTRNGKWTGDIRFCTEIGRSDLLEQPLHWREPQMIGVQFMGDLFHNDVPFEHINKIFAIARLCGHHKFILLTKRPKRTLEYYEYLDKYDRTERILSEKQLINDVIENITGDLFPYGQIVSDVGWPLPNVWLGVSVENDNHHDRIIDLLNTPAAVRLISVEPMLGPVDFTKYFADIECPNCGWLGYGDNDTPEGGLQKIYKGEPEWTAYGDEGYDDPNDEGVWVCPECKSSEDSGMMSYSPFHNPFGPDPRIDGVICGCESGPGRRETKIEWVRNLRDQCVNAGVPFFLKQLDINGKIVKMPELDGKVWDQLPK